MKTKTKQKRYILSKAETRNLSIPFINPEKPKELSVVKQDRPPLQTTNNWDKLKQVITSDTTRPVRERKRNSEQQSSAARSAVKREARRQSGKKRKASEANNSSTRKKSRSLVQAPSTDKSSTLAKGPTTIWFDDVDPSLLEYVESSSAAAETENADGEEVVVNMTGTESELVKPASYEGLTKALAMDCEMVGVGTNQSILARVSIVNSFGHCLYDTFVRPTEKVTDYRTAVSGVRPNDVKNAPSFEEVQKKVYSLVDQRILVGHALRNDLQVLFLSHPRKMIRDTARYTEFRKLFQGKTPSLKNLTDKVLGVRIQSGEHNSIEDARAAMRLYTMYKVQWEKQLKHKVRTSSKRAKDGGKT